MKRLLIFLGIVLLVASSLTAQLSTGNIYGKVVDKSGEALPGVTVTLTGSLTGAVPFVTTAEGSFRFISLAPAGDYSLKAELQGFKTTTRGNILIVSGSNVDLTLTLEQGTLSEEVTVTAVTPIIDAKKTSIGVNISQEILQALPSSRDPFSIMKMAVGTVTYTEDVGGSEGGQAVIPTARGGFTQNLYIIDGAVTNLAVNPGTITTYYDFDSFEEMSVTVGGADVSVQTGGVQLNMVTRRGGNKPTFGGRFYLTDSRFQANNMSDDLRKEGLAGTNRINVIRDYGFYLSGPIIKDKFWFYGSYGMQDIQNITIYNAPSKSTLQTLIAKLNLQIVPQNRFEFFAQGNKKLMWGAGPSTYDPDGTDRLSTYHFGYPTIRIQDEHMFGDNIFASLRWVWVDAAYPFASPRDNEMQLLAINDLRDKRAYGGVEAGGSHRPQGRLNGSLSYFNDKLFGVSHEIKVGFEYLSVLEEVEWGYPGNMLLDRNFVDPTADFTGDGLPDIPTDSKFYGLTLKRGYHDSSSSKAYAGYISDTLSFGRFNITLGVRYDKQLSKVNPTTIKAIDRAKKATSSTLNSKTIDLLDSLLPAVQIPEVLGTAADGSRYSWRVLSPRFSLSYDITGDGKTLAKLSFSQYGNMMTTDNALRNRPGGYAGWLYFYWWDNGDYKVDPSELYWYTIKSYKLYRVFDDNGNFTGNWKDGADKFWGGYDYANPTKLNTSPYVRIDADAGSPLTTELLFTLEREIVSNFSVQLNLCYRRNTNTTLTYKYFPDTNTLIDQSFYVSAGTAPASIPGVSDTGGAKDHEWYYQNAQATAYSPYTWIKKNKDYYSTYWGFDLVLAKRLTNKWMLNSSFSYQFSAPYWGQAGFIDPNNRWAIEGVNNAPLWALKIGGLYQLPYDINFSANLIAHQGRRINRTINLTDYRLPNPKSRSAALYLDPAGAETLPAMFNLGIRLEKMFRFQQVNRIYFMVDIFNALNLITAETRNARLLGNYYIYPNAAQNRLVSNISSGLLTKILNPRVARIGVRFEF
jgi:hypothetical protein